MSSRVKISIGAVFIIVASSLAAGIIGLAGPKLTQAAPNMVVYASPIQAGCYLATRSSCKIKVDPFTITKSMGAPLVGFQLYANGSLLYDFKTDVSNPPLGSYSPTSVKLDFGVTCGKTYTVDLLAKDGDSPNYFVLGRAENIVCPAGIFETFLPAVTR